MSLIAWFPLNGKTINYGTGTFTMNGFPSYGTGKVTASCYSNSSYETGSIYSSETFNLGLNQSMCCWVKFNSLKPDSSLGGALVSQHRYLNNTGMGLTIKYISSTTGYISVNTGNGSSRTYNTYCGSTLLSAGIWYHVCYTFDGTTIKLYVNGVLDGTHSDSHITSMSIVEDYLMVGAWSFNASTGNAPFGFYKLNGYLNDVRVYNHTLSAKEVKNIAKGLCLHYSFNFDDLYTPVEYIQSSGTQYIDTGFVPVSTTTMECKVAATSSYIFGCGRDEGYGGNAFLGSYYNGSGLNIEYGAINVGYVAPISGINTIKTYIENGNYYANNNGTIGSTSVTSHTTTGHFLIGAVANASTQVPAFKGSAKYYYMKLFNDGVLVRDFIPAVRKLDAKPGLFDRVNNVFYTNAGSDEFSYPGTITANAIIPDDSGYNNNLVVSSMSLSSDTPVGTQSVVNGNSYNHSQYPAPRDDTYNKELTVCCWFKQTDRTGYQALVVNRWNNGGSYNWMLYTHRGPSSVAGTLEGSIQLHGANQYPSQVVPSLNEWHFVAVTVDSNLRYRMYLDGVQQKVDGTNYDIAFSYAQVGTPPYVGIGGLEGGEQFQGSFGDVKIFATALSGAEILDLYQSKAIIDSTGNVYCDTAVTSFSDDVQLPNSKGVIKCGDVGYSAEARINGYKRLEYIENTGHTQYIDSGWTPNFTNGYKIETCFTSTGNTDGTNRGGFVSNYDASLNLSLELVDNKIRTYINDNDRLYSSNTYTINSKNTAIISYYSGTVKTILNGTTSTASYSITGTSGSSCRLFVDKYDGGRFSTFTVPTRIYYMKIWDGYKLIRDFIPVKRTTDNAIGLYDCVNGVFYGNAGSGTFTAGTEYARIVTGRNFYIGNGYNGMPYKDWLWLKNNPPSEGWTGSVSITNSSGLTVQYSYDNSSWSSSTATSFSIPTSNTTPTVYLRGVSANNTATTSVTTTESSKTASKTLTATTNSATKNTREMVCEEPGSRWDVTVVTTLDYYANSITGYTWHATTINSAYVKSATFPYNGNYNQIQMVCNTRNRWGSTGFFTIAYTYITCSFN